MLHWNYQKESDKYWDKINISKCCKKKKKQVLRDDKILKFLQVTKY